jgi:CBS-domain-containing membrane protein
MKHCTVAAVMTTDVVTVTTEEPFKSLAALFVGQRISTLPVVGRDGRLAGIVSESDLLEKAERQADPSERRPRRGRRAARAKAAADCAGEVMTTHVVTVRPDATVAEAAWLMDRHHVTCLPVVDEAGKLQGIVSPRDLLRVFLRPDAEIREDIYHEVLRQTLGTNPVLVNVDVCNGMVTLTGEVERKSMTSFVLPLVRAVDGVVDAEADLQYAIDDSHIPSGPVVPAD